MITTVNAVEVVIKETRPVRLAELRGVAAGLAPEHIGPVFLRLSPLLIGHLRQAGARPGTLVQYYDEPAEDGSVGVHVGYEIGQQPVPAGHDVQIVELPVVQVASTVHRGAMDHVVGVYRSLLRWIEEEGYRLTGNSRELYHKMGASGPRVTELQLPIAK